MVNPTTPSMPNSVSRLSALAPEKTDSSPASENRLYVHTTPVLCQGCGIARLASTHPHPPRMGNLSLGGLGGRRRVVVGCVCMYSWHAPSYSGSVDIDITGLGDRRTGFWCLLMADPAKPTAAASKSTGEPLQSPQHPTVNDTIHCYTPLHVATPGVIFTCHVVRSTRGHRTVDADVEDLQKGGSGAGGTVPLYP